MIAVSNLVSQAGAFRLNAELTIQKHEYFVLLGRSGSGKTILLETICGLRPFVSGELSISGKDVSFIPPRQRCIGYVPQDEALFSHLDVRSNIEFSLKIRKQSQVQINTRVHELAGLLGITGLLDRRIAGLSGGERQRVALARALAPQPDVLLLDEPVSALDEHGRAIVLREIRRLQQTLHLTVLHVCHSLEEARLVADRVGIMMEGRIVQTGSLNEIQQSPQSMEVARIIGCENVIDMNDLDTSSPGIQFEAAFYDSTKGKRGFLIPPEHIHTINNQSSPGNRITGTIGAICRIGPLHRLCLYAPVPVVFYIALQSDQRIDLGQEITIGFDSSSIIVFD